MKKKYSFIFLASLNYFCFAQVGINTSSPKSTLHLNGSLQITKDLNVGGTDTSSGYSGKEGEILTSNGVGKSPEWIEPNKINIPQVINISNRTTTGTLVNANTAWNIQFNHVDHDLSSYITYNTSNYTFIINKSGYYLVNSNAKATIICGANNACGGTYKLSLSRNGAGISANSTGYDSTNKEMQENLSTTTFFNKGDIIRVAISYTRNMYTNEASVSFTYLSE